MWTPTTRQQHSRIVTRYQTDLTDAEWRVIVFRDWAGDETHFQREVIEAALAHAVGSAVEAAYRRSDALQKRRELMDTWAGFVTPKADAKVVRLRPAG